MFYDFFSARVREKSVYGPSREYDLLLCVSIFRLFGATCSFSASCHDRKNVEQRSFRFLVPNVVSVQVVMTAKMLSRDQERT